jgi:hypothetical protein
MIRRRRSDLPGTLFLSVLIGSQHHQCAGIHRFDAIVISQFFKFNIFRAGIKDDSPGIQ